MSQPRVRPEALTPRQVINPRIDVAAQRALLRLSRDPTMAGVALGLVSAIDRGRLAGIYGDDLRAAALLASRLGTVRWQLVPRGQDAAVVVDPQSPLSGPAVVFREQLRGLPARLDDALRHAWATLQLLLSGSLSRCPPAPSTGNGTVARPSLRLPLGNLVPPVLCQLPQTRDDVVGIVLSATLADGSPTTECAFEASLGGSAFTRVPLAGGQALVPLPVSPRPLHVAVRVRSTDPSRWDIEGTFELGTDGALRTLSAPDEFHPPQPIRLPGGRPAVSVVAVMSRVCNATDHVMRKLGEVPCRRKDHPPRPWPPSSWGTPALPSLNYVASPPVASGELQFDSRALDPDTDDVVLQVAGVRAPELLAVSWPAGVSRAAGAGATPFVVYFHPSVGQNVEDGYYVRQPYPFGWDYLFYGLWKYVNYITDPLTDERYAKGLPYQISASGKNVVLVLPCNRLGDEVGVFVNAAATSSILREVQAFMFRRRGVYSAPGLGRAALAAFSSGNGFITQFLRGRSNRSHPFYLDTLQEVYLFDPPGGLIGSCVDEARRWAASGSHQGKRIRCYSQFPHDAHRRLVSGPLPRSTPFVTESPSGRATAAVLPVAAWTRAASGRRAVRPVRGWQDAHQLISAMLLTDALRRSAF